MTIGIAAVCTHKGEQVIVLCTDWQGTRGFVKADDTYKMYHVPNATVLVSGDEGASRELALTVGVAAKKFNQMPQNSGDLDLRIGQYLAEIRNVVGDHKKARQDAYVRRQYGISLSDFFARGQSIYTQYHYDQIYHELRRVNLGAELLLAYGDSDEPILIRIDADGEVHWEHGYSAIGSGATIALSILCQTDHRDSMRLMDRLMWVFEAKLAAEQDPYVGRTTTFWPDVCRKQALRSKQGRMGLPSPAIPTH